MQQHPPPMVRYYHPQTSDYLQAPVYPRYLFTPPSSPPSSPSSSATSPIQGPSHSEYQKGYSKSRAQGEKHCAKRKAKKQRRGERKKALQQATAKADELALKLQRLDLEGVGVQTTTHQKGKRDRRDSIKELDTPLASLHSQETSEADTHSFDDGYNTSSGEDPTFESAEDEDENDRCKPFFRTGTRLKCCAAHGKGCWRFPDLIGMKRYLPTWRGLKTGEEDRLLRKHSV